MIHRHTRGAAGQQYAIIVGLIAVLGILAVTTLGNNVKVLFTNTGNVLTSVTNGTVGTGTGTGQDSGQQTGGSFPFTTHTFTPCGATGRSGPGQSPCRTQYDTASQGNWDENSAYFSVSGGIQLWTVPETKTYRITVAGAKGGGTNGGTGAIMRGDFALTAGNQIRIVVGQRGQTAQSAYHMGGGGGGSAVSVIGQTAPLIVAGGGAGTSWNSYEVSANRNATTSNLGNVGGIVTYSYYYATSCPYNYWEGGGGGGWGADGMTCTSTSYNANLRSGKALNGTAEGGMSADLNGTNDSCGFGGVGGFGGGGGTGSCSGAAGGGGGYSGGNAAYSTSASYLVANMGGGSFNSGTTPSNTTGNTADGYVTITKQ